MAYFGLVPSEHSSGNREYRGSITKAGNVHVRRLLVEAAWNNRHNAGAALVLKRRRQGQAPEIVAIAMKAQLRLVNKFLRLDKRKHRYVAITARRQRALRLRLGHPHGSACTLIQTHPRGEYR